MASVYDRRGAAESSCDPAKELAKHLENLLETVEIATDRRLFNQILAAAETLEDDLRIGKLHSVEEAFGDD